VKADLGSSNTKSNRHSWPKIEIPEVAICMHCKSEVRWTPGGWIGKSILCPVPHISVWHEVDY